MKFTDDSLPETLLQSPSPVPIAESEMAAVAHPVPAKPDYFEPMLARIKEFHSKLDMEELNGKSIEMFVCNICYEIYARTDLLREHYITVSGRCWLRRATTNNKMFQAHGYELIKAEIEEIEDKTAEIEPEETQTPRTTAMRTETDSFWQKPISLIELRKKLNKAFTNKCELMAAVANRLNANQRFFPFSGAHWAVAATSSKPMTND